MEDYDYSEVKEPRKKRSPGLMWNVLTITVLLLTLIIAAAVITIFINPSSRLNPLAVSILNPMIATPTADRRYELAITKTPTQEILQLTSTQEPTDAPTVTDTPQATFTVEPQPITADNILYAFTVRRGSPAAIDGSQFHPDVGCKWLGVAGQATSMNGEAVQGLFVHLGGSLPGVMTVENISMTGLAPQYGSGGFEMTISDQLMASSRALWIQLLDQDNLPLSDRVYFDTFDDCAKNLVIIYFDQVR